jgi:protein CpxP
MTSTRTRILSIGAAVLLAVAAAVAQGMHGHGGPGAEFHHMLKQLNLSADQQTQVKAIFTQEKSVLQPLMAQMRQSHAAMEALVSNGFDEGKATTIATQNSQTMIQLEVEHAKMKSQIIAILTPAQKTQLAQMEANHEARMSKHLPPADSN